MTVKYSIEKTNPYTPQRIYPYFGVHSNGLIVRFTSHNTGMVFGESDNSPHKIGTFSDDWAEGNFTPMNVQEIVFKIL